MKHVIGLVLFIWPLLCFSQQDSRLCVEAVHHLSAWELAFFDDGTKNWQTNWFLDGEIAKVENSEKGMHLKPGLEFGNDAHHMVLWTKKSFTGDVKISFDYIRTDEETKAVNILYIQATGKGEGEFVEDITFWSHLRSVPSMRTYFNNMKMIHISFAAFPNNEETVDYIRVRNYPVTPERGFRELEVEPTFHDTGLFKTGVTYRITVTKTDKELFFEVNGDNKAKSYFWDISHLPQITEGRIGLRHMYTRSALYQNFEVWTR